MTSEDEGYNNLRFGSLSESLTPDIDASIISLHSTTQDLPYRTMDDADESDIDFELVDDDMVSSMSSIGAITTSSSSMQDQDIHEIASDSHASLSEASFDMSVNAEDLSIADFNADTDLALRLSEPMIPRELTSFQFLENSNHTIMAFHGPQTSQMLNETNPMDEAKASFTATLATPLSTQQNSPSSSAIFARPPIKKTVSLELLLVGLDFSISKAIRRKFSQILSQHFMDFPHSNLQASSELLDRPSTTGQRLTTVLCPMSNFVARDRQPYFEAFVDSGVRIVEQHVTIKELIEGIELPADSEYDPRTIWSRVCVIDVSKTGLNEWECGLVVDALRTWQIIPLVVRPQKSSDQGQDLPNNLLQILSTLSAKRLLGGKSQVTLSGLLELNDRDAFQALFTQSRRTNHFRKSHALFPFLITVLGLVTLLGILSGFNSGVSFSRLIAPTKSVETRSISTETHNLSSALEKSNYPSLRRMTDRKVSTIAPSDLPDMSVSFRETSTSLSIRIEDRKDIILNTNQSPQTPTKVVNGAYATATNVVHTSNVDASTTFDMAYDTASTAASNMAMQVSETEMERAQEADIKILAALPYETWFSIYAPGFDISALCHRAMSYRDLFSLTMREQWEIYSEWLTIAFKATGKALYFANEYILDEWQNSKEQVMTGVRKSLDVLNHEFNKARKKASQCVHQSRKVTTKNFSNVMAGYRRLAKITDDSFHWFREKQDMPVIWLKGIRHRFHRRRNFSYPNSRHRRQQGKIRSTHISGFMMHRNKEPRRRRK